MRLNCARSDHSGMSGAACGEVARRNSLGTARSRERYAYASASLAAVFFPFWHTQIPRFGLAARSWKRPGY